MQFDFIVAGLPFLHEIVARHVAKHSAEGFLLFGLPIFAGAFGVPTKFTHGSWRRTFEGPAFKVAVDASPSHIEIGSLLTQIEILGEPSAPSAIAHLVLGLDQHLSGDAIVLLAGCITLLQLALNKRDQHLKRTCDIAALRSDGLAHFIYLPLP